MSVYLPRHIKLIVLAMGVALALTASFAQVTTTHAEIVRTCPGPRPQPGI